MTALRLAARLCAASLALVGLLFVIATSFTARHAEPRASAGAFARPVVAVLDVRNTNGDSGSAWLELSVPQLLASEVARAPGVDVVAPDFVREAREKMGLRSGRLLSRQDVLRFGRGIDARWVATASIERSDSVYVLDVTLHDVTGDTPPRVFRASDASLITLADLAAGKLASYAVTPDR